MNLGEHIAFCQNQIDAALVESKTNFSVGILMWEMDWRIAKQLSEEELEREITNSNS